MRTIDKIITKCDTSRGAPMGRPMIHPDLEEINGVSLFKINGTVFDCRVPMCADGCYDRGGAYWGIGKELRVIYTKDLTYVEFYRR